MSYDKLFDQFEDGVDPRVQVELEKLNSSTDEINRLEVDLDEARSQFRQLLRDSTSQIENCGKKLGNCVVKVKPYYDARIQAKEALQETQKAAANFERANSAHAAAKEMVYLAEEGLKTEGRTFDHAWQEMLNHATMRVNESESERMKCEAEHKKTSQVYQVAEVRVQALQKELKKAIIKSRPYYELKVHCNQLLEKQKKKVKDLEKQVAEVKLTYAHTLKNLEQISDEIHKNRQKSDKAVNFDLTEGSNETEQDSHCASDICNKWMQNNYLKHGNHNVFLNQNSECAKSRKFIQESLEPHYENKLSYMKCDNERGDGVYFKEDTKILSPTSDTVSSGRTQTSTTLSSQPDTDVWSENSDENFKASPTSENDSSFTGPPDTESEEETFRLSKIHEYNALRNLMVKGAGDSCSSTNQSQLTQCDLIKESFFNHVGICSFPNETELNVNFSDKNFRKKNNEEDSNSDWTEIKLRSPEEEIFSTVKAFCLGKTKSELEEFDIPYAPLAELEGLNEPGKPESNLIIEGCVEKNELNEVYTSYAASKKGNELQNEDSIVRSLKGTPKKLNIRRQSLDVLWNSQEKVKEILSQSIMKLNIGTLTEKKVSESKLGEGSRLVENESSICKGNGVINDSNTKIQSGVNILSRKNSRSEDDNQSSNSEEKTKGNFQDALPSHLGGFMSRKDRFFTKKIPSPLERTLNYLNTDDESNSDSESLASLDALTDEQLSSLVLDKDLSEIYQDII